MEVGRVLIFEGNYGVNGSKRHAHVRAACDTARTEMKLEAAVGFSHLLKILSLLTRATCGHQTATTLSNNVERLAII